MKCKKCKREIEKNSVFCNWCGYRQVADSTDVRVPEPRRKGNKWFAQVTVNDERVYISADSEEEYYAKARAAKAHQIEIKKRPSKLTLGEAIDRYIKENRNVLSPSTINAYESYRKTRFQRYIDRQVCSIPFQRMVNDECVDLAPKTVHNAFRLVSASLRYAGVDIGKVNLPQKPKADRPWLDYQQILILLDKCEGKPYELGIILALHGLRRSELLHLTAEDIDTEAGLIHVRGASVIGSSNKLVDKTTNKNRSSTRDVHIVIPRLKELVRGKNGRLITTNPTTLYGSINGLCKRNGLPEVGVHGLRHSFASLAYHLKWSEATTMREGGWADAKTVNGIYTHLAAQDASVDITTMIEYYADKSCTKPANPDVSTALGS